MSDKKVAIIIVTFNASKYLGELFSSIEKIIYPKDKFEIIVVDNASTDDTLEKIRDCFAPLHSARNDQLNSVIARIRPLAETKQSTVNGGLPRSPADAGSLAMTNIKLIPQKTNTGFTGGNNIGLQYAIDNGFDYAYMLNQDTVVEPNFIQEAIQVAEGDDKIAAVQSLLLLYDKKDTVNSMGNYIHYLGFAYAGGNGQKAISYKLQATSREITYPSGAGVLLRLSVLKKIGLLHPELFMYHEDVELGWRMRLCGYKIMLAPKSIVYHKYEFSRSMKKYYYMERNRFIVMLEKYKLATIIVILPALITMEILMFAYSFISGFWKEKLFAYGYFLRPNSWKKIFAERKRNQKMRIATDREIIKRFVSMIESQENTNLLIKYIFNPIFYLYLSVIKIIIFW